jgi:SET domain-containing protein
MVDARKYGNVGRFVNHSCDPNMVVIRVVDDFSNRKTPMSAFFTVRDVAAGEELT